MDNLDQRTELEREEQLVRLLEMTARYGVVRACDVSASTEAQRHRFATGHTLRFGCCKAA